MKEIRRINKRRVSVEQDLVDIRSATKDLKLKLNELKSDHDAFKKLAYRFIGGF